MSKVDRSILANNDQNMGMTADPNKLESSISHLADVIDANDTAKTDKTGDHQGTWNGLTPGQAAEPINGARLNVLEPVVVRGAGERIEIIEVSFAPNGTSNSISGTGLFAAAFASPPNISPMQVTQTVAYADRLLLPHYTSLTTSGFGVIVKTDGTNNLGAGTLKMKFLVIGK
ncbi:hypothetical protein CVD25_01110 [Bacillus canaveralius]|uniref:Uncharacterized protein n=1 Tax=Bacillus canaveralius TaxID=1403243 RepID=A0A2N5GPN2_9BACI|nr:hypothetical protein [Bacillus canaveralius]PLR84663.1 hypothetical protein CU635_06220 [Bacillus canaveralius]PLS00815.1 hypothetical protein CVD25_01110 [Bacillus canaveralius]